MTDYWDDTTNNNLIGLNYTDINSILNNLDLNEIVNDFVNFIVDTVHGAFNFLIDEIGKKILGRIADKIVNTIFDTLKNPPIDLGRLQQKLNELVISAAQQLKQFFSNLASIDWLEVLKMAVLMIFFSIIPPLL